MMMVRLGCVQALVRWLEEEASLNRCEFVLIPANLHRSGEGDSVDFGLTF